MERYIRIYNDGEDSVMANIQLWRLFSYGKYLAMANIQLWQGRGIS